MKNSQMGFAMIEVTIAMWMMAFVFLSLLLYQISITRHIQASYLQAIAIMQLMNFSDVLRVNQDDAHRQQAATQWNQDNARLLPKAHGTMIAQETHQCAMQLCWLFRKKYCESVDVFC